MDRLFSPFDESPLDALAVWCDVTDKTVQPPNPGYDPVLVVKLVKRGVR